ncbi:MAG: hypothetical protein R3Y58_14505 [Eubacteriales bacterium]
MNKIGIEELIKNQLDQTYISLTIMNKTAYSGGMQTEVDIKSTDNCKRKESLV